MPFLPSCKEIHTEFISGTEPSSKYDCQINQIVKMGVWHIVCTEYEWYSLAVEIVEMKLKFHIKQQIYTLETVLKYE